MQNGKPFAPTNIEKSTAFMNEYENYYHFNYVHSGEVILIYSALFIGASHNVDISNPHVYLYKRNIYQSIIFLKSL